MSYEKLYEKFVKENPNFPNYILEDLKKEMPEKLSENIVKEILDNTLKEYDRSLICPSESIGVITAQSFGEPATQMTLNTFHFAGVSSQSVEGLPRIIEIVDMKKTLGGEAMKIYLKNKKIKEEEVKLLANKIKETKLSHFIKEINVDISQKTGTVKFDINELSKNKIDIGNLINYFDEKIKKSSEVKSDEIFITFPQSYGFKEISNVKEMILNITIMGIKGISDITIIKENNEFVLLTKGSSLKQVLKLEEVDENRLYSNNIEETYKIFGVEAARNVIIKEINEVISSQGLTINERHVLLVADAMTSSGKPKGMTRFGIVADKINVLTKAAFETPIKHITKASLLDEEDDINSITENVMTNQMSYVGTGIPKIKVKSKK